MPPADAQALAGAIRTLLDDRDRAGAMGLRGREKVRAEFDLRDSVRRLVALLAVENRAA